MPGLAAWQYSPTRTKTSGSIGIRLREDGSLPLASYYWPYFPVWTSRHYRCELAVCSNTRFNIYPGTLTLGKRNPGHQLLSRSFCPSPIARTDFISRNSWIVYSRSSNNTALEITVKFSQTKSICLCTNLKSTNLNLSLSTKYYRKRTLGNLKRKFYLSGV
jgi:hypothetical protein